MRNILRQAVKYNPPPKKKVSNICYNGIAKHQKQEEGYLLGKTVFWKLPAGQNLQKYSTSPQKHIKIFFCLFASAGRKHKSFILHKIKNKKSTAGHSFTIFMTTSTAVPVKKISCKAQKYFARYFPVYPIWFCGLALKSKLCEPALSRKRKILIISLQSQPTLVGWTHNTETPVIAAVVRVFVVIPGRHFTAGSTVEPRAATLYAVRTRRRAGQYLFIRT